MGLRGTVLRCAVLVFVVSIRRQVSAASYLYINNTGNYKEGRQLCQQFGLDLAKVSSDQDLEDLHAMYQNISGVTVAWLGLQYNGSAFLWPDGSDVEITAWNVYSDEPDFLTTSQCAIVKQSVMLWHTRPCTRQYPVLCGPYQQEDVLTPEIQDATFSLWRSSQVLNAEPTVSQPETSIRACAKNCLKVENCIFFSLDGEMCDMYSNVTTITTSWAKDNTRIWKRDYTS